MSRPFSYNDENFTVIGNVLFVHIIDNKARESNEPVVEIPPAIFERIKTSTNTCLVSYNDFINQNQRIFQRVFNLLIYLPLKIMKTKIILRF